jgi:hypothetical protein
VKSDGTFFELAREGDFATGAEPARFKQITSIAMPKPGQVFFTAKLATSSATDMGLWAWSDYGGLQLLLRDNGTRDVDTYGTVQLKSFQTLTSVKGSPGHARYDHHQFTDTRGEPVTVDVLANLTDGRSAILGIEADGTLHITAVTGNTTNEGFVLSKLGMPSSPGQPALAQLKTSPADGVTAANNRGIYFGSIPAQKGTTALDAVPATAKFKSFLDPIGGYDAIGDLMFAFTATLSGTARNTGIWSSPTFVNDPDSAAPARGPAADPLRLVALKGGEPPDVTGTKWKAFTSLAIMDYYGVMFTATLSSGTTRVKPSDDTGLWSMDANGFLHLVFREGQEVAPGRTLRNFQVLGAVTGSPSQRRAWTHGDYAGRVIYRAYFTDGTTGIVTTVAP